jgi:hypothetical protein
MKDRRKNIKRSKMEGKEGARKERIKETRKGRQNRKDRGRGNPVTRKKKRRNVKNMRKK